MNADDFRNAVLALGDPAAGRALLERHLFDRYRAIEAMPDLSQRRHLHRAHVLASRELILGLMRSDAAVDSSPALAGRMLALGNHGVSRWMALLRHVQYRYRARVARRVFHHGSCGAYPLRDGDHEEVHVTALRALDAHALPHPLEDLDPFICPRLSRRARAAAYTARLAARRLTPADLRAPGEGALVGQWGLFAATAIGAGTCLGIYGGQVLDETDIFLLRDDRYLMSASARTGEVAINGENMMSLMNTLFEVAADGRTVGHPARGYNVASLPLHAQLRDGRDGRELRVNAFHAIADIPAGTELRWNYDLAAG